MRRRLPSPEETLRILAAKRTRPPRRAAPPLGRSLAPLIRELDGRFGKTPAALQARWREVAGERLGARSEPVKLVTGRAGGPATLEVRVDGPSAALIQHQSAELIQRVNLFLGAGAVDRLRIVQGPVKPQPAPATAAPRKRAKPLDAEVEASLAAGVEPAADDRLREALLRLGRAVLRRDAERR